MPDQGRAGEAYSRVGQFIRSTHPYGFRVGTWGRVLGVVEDGPNGHPCYLVGFDDEVTDRWVIDDPSDHYEFSEKRPCDVCDGAVSALDQWQYVEGSSYRLGHKECLDA